MLQAAIWPQSLTCDSMAWLELPWDQKLGSMGSGFGLRSYEIALQKKDFPWVESMFMVMVHGLSSISSSTSLLGNKQWYWRRRLLWFVSWSLSFRLLASKLVSEESSSKPQIQNVFCCVFKLDAWNVQSTKTAPKTNFKPQTAYNLDLGLDLHLVPELKSASLSAESLAISPRAERSLAPQTWRPPPNQRHKHKPIKQVSSVNITNIKARHMVQSAVHWSFFVHDSGPGSQGPVWVQAK